MSESNPRGSTLLIEFNELSATLLRDFMSRGELPNFTRFYRGSSIFTTTAGNDPLEPWIQWPTIHCGVPFAEHRARHLGDGRGISQKALGTILSDNGIAVGIFGMINGNYRRPKGYHLPDPWDSRERVHPPELLPFFDFVSLQIRENSRGLKVTPKAAIAFARFMITHGLSMSTVASILRHVASEIFNPGLRWRRSVLLDSIQYDVFKSLNAKFDVRFASFFSNSTAHLQHYYWRNMDPRRFDEAPEPDSDPSLRHAVLFGYRSMDKILGRMMRDYPQSRLILCTGLSQEAWYGTSKCTFRPVDFESFLRFAGIDVARVRISPVMAERFRVECTDADEARATQAALDALRFRQRPLMASAVEGDVVYTGCSVYDPDCLTRDEPILSRGASELFSKLFYRVTAMNSGRHNPEGTLWIKDGFHRVHADPLPLYAIAPMVLSHFGVGDSQFVESDRGVSESCL